MTPRSEKTIAKAARKKPAAAPAEIQQDSRNIKAVTDDAKLSAWEQEKARAGFFGRVLGWGAGSRVNLVFILLAFVVVVMGVALLFSSDAELKRQIVDCFKFLGGALVGFLIRNTTK